MSTPIKLFAAALLLSSALLVGWAEPEAATRGAKRADCRVPQSTVPPEYLVYHGLVSPHGALGAPRVETACAPAPRRVRT
ncbi:MAG: hypothetical protein ACK4UX_07515 [Thiobacillus sp.]